VSPYSIPTVSARHLALKPQKVGKIYRNHVQMARIINSRWPQTQILTLAKQFLITRNGCSKLPAVGGQCSIAVQFKAPNWELQPAG
jgi:hypothetical protein